MLLTLKRIIMAKKHNYSFDIDQLMQKRIIMAKEIAQLQVQN